SHARGGKRSARRPGERITGRLPIGRVEYGLPMAVTTQSAPYGTRPRARRNLVRLLRLTLDRGWTVGAARIYVWVAAVGFAAMTWIASRGYGADATVMMLAARAAAVLVWVGGFAALAMASPPRDPTFRGSILALASMRGVDQSMAERAEVRAIVRLL